MSRVCCSWRMRGEYRFQWARGHKRSVSEGVSQRNCRVSGGRQVRQDIERAVQGPFVAEATITTESRVGLGVLAAHSVHEHAVEVGACQELLRVEVEGSGPSFAARKRQICKLEGVATE